MKGALPQLLKSSLSVVHGYQNVPLTIKIFIKSKNANNLLRKYKDHFGKHQKNISLV